MIINENAQEKNGIEMNLIFKKKSLVFFSPTQKKKIIKWGK